MHIQVKGKQIDVGAALTEHVESQLSAAVAKYFDRPVDATVTFSKERHAFRCDAHVHLATGLVAQSSSTAADVYAAFDQGADKIEKQIRRYKRRLKDHHKERAKPVDMLSAQSYVLQGGDEADEPESLKPVIVAESTDAIPSISVGEAVMQMELAGHAFLLFRHDATGRVNLVFSREDGNVGWMDPAESVASPKG
ncbi:MAG: ribosome-associated translation inhibitor RaiA [Pseudomonadota bacterium]